ncbi:MAG TPA: transglycosylase SLT domain-containing protein [Pseudonocardia sp.]|nr:transglycosylase SLT domain-containing protein [Pseudonocardia sp.]
MLTTGGAWLRLLSGIAAGMAALLVLLVISAAGDDDAGHPQLSGVDVTKIPKLARQMLPVVEDVLDRQCPELPPVWVMAEVQAESGWNPKAHSDDSNGGASGLYQINDRNWAAAGGRAGEITIPETHLRVGIPWVCTNLRAVTGHLAATGKPTEPLDAMLVCHIAGCGRVTGSATGVPRVGEAGCGSTCVSLINRYLNNVHRYVAQFSTPPAAPPGAVPPDAVPPGAVPPAAVLAEGAQPGVQPAAVTAQPAVTGQPVAGQPDARPAMAQGAPAAVGAGAGTGSRTVTLGGITTSLPLSPAPFTGAVTGCKLSDPTGRGCLTATTLYGLESAVDAFGDFHAGPTLHSAGCWDAHAWNPTSDHARGRACDLFPGAPGRFAQGEALAQGWRVANWYRANAAALHVKYLIWQGRYWQAGGRDVGGGWGQRYDGGGVYNTRSATGGHYDHVHVSYQD